MHLAGSRFRTALAGVLLALSVATFVGPAAAPVLAQDNEEKKDTPVADEAHETDLFTHILKSAGWFFGPILFGVSVALVTMIVMLAMDLRMSVAVPVAFVEDFTDTVNNLQLKRAYEMCKTEQSFLGRVLAAGMGRLQYGLEDAREAAVNMVESVKASKEPLINYLATIGTLGPMLGLVGTVYGMVKAFMELSAGGQPDTKNLAGAISHALVVTLLGIAISVPAIFFHAFFRNRLVRISLDTSNLADDLLTQMYHNSKKAAKEGAPVPVAKPVGGDSRTSIPTAKPIE
jgi:biopolymer transport protein ExbB